MSKEEQLAYIDYKDQEIEQFKKDVQKIVEAIEKFTSKEQLQKIVESLNFQYAEAELVTDYANGIKRSTRTCGHCQRQYIVTEDIFQVIAGTGDSISICTHCQQPNTHYSDPILNFFSRIFRI
jgi:hypothetical protein